MIFFHFRHEVKILRDGGLANKERLTVQWLTKSITELRNELSELQDSSNKITRDLQQKNQILDDISGLRTDFQNVRLELESLRTRQETSEVLVKELRDELAQNAEDMQKAFDRLFINQVGLWKFILIFYVYFMKVCAHNLCLCVVYT